MKELLDKLLLKLTFFYSLTNRFHRVIFIFLLVESRLLSGGKAGFLCNDPTLSHLFTGDTVSWKWLIGVTAVLPLIVMAIIEQLGDDRILARKKALKWYKEYLYGYLVNLTAVQSLKFIMGTPRPHFFDTCSPKEALTCAESEFVLSYTCTKAYWLSQSDRSFPSGHTSLAVHAGVFIIYYLHRRAVHIHKGVVRSLQVILCVATLLCSVSRIADRRHHLSDVCGGAIVAAIIVYYTICRLCRQFNWPKPKEDNINENCESSIENDNALPNAGQTKSKEITQ